MRYFLSLLLLSLTGTVAAAEDKITIFDPAYPGYSYSDQALTAFKNEKHYFIPPFTPEALKPKPQPSFGVIIDERTGRHLLYPIPGKEEKSIPPLKGLSFNF